MLCQLWKTHLWKDQRSCLSTFAILLIFTICSHEVDPSEAIPSGRCKNPLRTYTSFLYTASDAHRFTFWPLIWDHKSGYISKTLPLGRSDDSHCILDTLYVSKSKHLLASGRWDMHCGTHLNLETGTIVPTAVRLRGAMLCLQQIVVPPGSLNLWSTHVNTPGVCWRYLISQIELTVARPASHFAENCENPHRQMSTDNCEILQCSSASLIFQPWGPADCAEHSNSSCHRAAEAVSAYHLAEGDWINHK